MIFRIGRGLVFSALAFFAFVGFVSVPLGNKSGFEHLRAIAGTPEAALALNEIKSRLFAMQSQVSHWLFSFVARDSDHPGRPEPAPQREASTEHTPQRHKIHIESPALPRPTPPQFNPVVPSKLAQWLFCYGTLCDNQLFCALTGEPVADGLPAKLFGWRCFQVPGSPYLGVVRADDASVVMGILRRITSNAKLVAPG